MRHWRVLVLFVAFAASTSALFAGCDWYCEKGPDWVSCSYRYDIKGRGTMSSCIERTWCDGPYCQTYCEGSQCYVV